MGGNVSEWCLDWYAPYDAAPQTDPQQNNRSLSDKPRRVLRGGSWNRDAKNTRSAARFRSDPRSRNADIGFRIVCETSLIAPIVEAPLDAPIAPPVHIEPPPPQSAPIESPFHSSSGSFPIPDGNLRQVDHLFPGFLCLLIPIGFVLVIIRLALRGRGTSPSALPMSSRPILPTPRSISPPMNLHPGVRMVDNGFWINSDWPVGTPIFLSYLVNGIVEQHSVVYQPSGQGQFIFTGQRPDNVSVSTTGNQPPPLQTQPPPLFDRNDDQVQQIRRPSFNPPAY
jgi:hypothetical protein